MYERVVTIPASAMVEEDEYSVTAAAATRNGVTVDGADWFGALRPDFSINRQDGSVFLDASIRAETGSINLLLEYGRPTFPVDQAVPVLTFTNRLTVAVPPATWGTIQGFRIEARFWRLSVFRTGVPDPTTGYLVSFIRSA